MQRHSLGAVRKYLCVWLGSLLWMPALASAQDAPVTVVIQFEPPAVEAFGGSGGGDLAISTISAAGVTSLRSSVKSCFQEWRARPSGRLNKKS